MDREDIERMAREFGFVPHYTRPQDAVVRNGYALSGELKGYKAGMLDIERFFHAAYAAGAAAERDKYEAKFKQLEAIMQAREQQPNKPCCLAEREACAKLCEELAERFHAHAADCAAAIRARGAGMNYQPQDFARCAGNPCFEYCKACKRNVANSPVNPKSDRQWWMGPWIMEDEKCPSFTENKEDV